MKKQVIFIGGGNPKENYVDYYDYIKNIEVDPYSDKFLNYNKTLGKYLGDEYEYFLLPMPDRKFADYEAWKIIFEKHIPFIKNNCTIVTTSLGSTFILKYLQTNNINIKIDKLFLLAAAVEDSEKEILGSFTLNNYDFSLVEKQCNNIYAYHSRDDNSVPFGQFKILQSCFSNLKMRVFENKGHFYKEERIKELEEDIKN